LRRQISAETGAAHLLWCSVPPAGFPAEALAVAFDQRLATKLRNASSLRVTLTLTWFAILKPLIEAGLQALLQKPRRAVRRAIVRQIVRRTLKGSVIYLDQDLRP
jgi:hypothetical protein